ncbi:BON domain protein [Bremerella volcania]|uniref:BON domain protein n=1 Tax=Bremerella volcania TaxID=2527984 RepID=A0A518CES2_9BACT|nr:BON domain protein [Bremerella volcania]
MFGNQVSDKDLQRKVDRTMERTGVNSQAKVKARVVNGTVELSGALQYENQRRPILKVIRSIQGVQRVNDLMACPPKPKRTDA